VTVDEAIEETPARSARVTASGKKVNKRQQHERNVKAQTGGADVEVETAASPASTANGHSAKGAPKRTRSTRKTS
jgi:hypothetical protein